MTPTQMLTTDYRQGLWMINCGYLMREPPRNAKLAPVDRSGTSDFIDETLIVTNIKC